MEEYCHCGHEVEYGHDWSNFDPRRQYIACPLFKDEGLECTYFRWVDSEGTKWKKKTLLSSTKRMMSLEPRYIT